MVSREEVWDQIYSIFYDRIYEWYLSWISLSFFYMITLWSWMTQEINKFFNNIVYAWAIKQKANSRFISRSCFIACWLCMRKIAFDWHEKCSFSLLFARIKHNTVWLKSSVWQKACERFSIHIRKLINQFNCLFFPILSRRIIRAAFCWRFMM